MTSNSCPSECGGTLERSTSMDGTHDECSDCKCQVWPSGPVICERHQPCPECGGSDYDAEHDICPAREAFLADV